MKRFQLALALATIMISSQAGAIEHNLRWTHPDPDNAKGFTFHIGSSEGVYDPLRMVTIVGLEPVDGFYSATVDIGDPPSYIAIRAFNQNMKSDFSNERLFMVPEAPEWAMETTAVGSLASLFAFRRR